LHFAISEGHQGGLGLSRRGAAAQAVLQKDVWSEGDDVLSTWRPQAFQKRLRTTLPESRSGFDLTAKVNSSAN
jgi:hypothetical protein